MRKSRLASNKTIRTGRKGPELYTYFFILTLPLDPGRGGDETEKKGKGKQIIERFLLNRRLFILRLHISTYTYINIFYP